MSSQSVLLPSGQRVALVRTVIMTSGIPSGGSVHFDQSAYWIFAANRFFDIRLSLEEGSPSVGQGYCLENLCHTTVRLADELTEMTYVSDAYQIRLSGSSQTLNQTVAWLGTGSRTY